MAISMYTEINLCYLRLKLLQEFWGTLNISLYLYMFESQLNS